ncbi:MAG: hypothetical protein ACOYVD_04930 [Bacillota bacterium]
MAKLSKVREVIVAYNASGAARAAREGYVVMIVDVIDMSTSLEAALQGGAFMVLGASPDITKAPVQVNPYKIGAYAASKAREEKKEIVIIAEPRWGTKEERISGCSLLLQGLGGRIKDYLVIPNLGGEVGKIVSFKNKIVICVSDTGGVAYDAAWQYSKNITTGTIARTIFSRSNQSAVASVERVLGLAKEKNIAVVAASGNAIEDVLAANYLAQKIIEGGQLDLHT